MPEQNGSVEVAEKETAGFDGELQSKEMEPAESQLDQLLAAIGALQEQFSEKIMVDAHKNALFDKMHQELISYRNGMLDKIVETMALDIIQLVDSTKRSFRVYTEKESSCHHERGSF